MSNYNEKKPLQIQKAFMITLLIILSIPTFVLLYFAMNSNNSNLEEASIGILWTNPSEGFYIFFIIFIVILGIISYFLMKMKWAFNLNEIKSLRAISDDLFITFYLIGWVLYSLPLTFRPTPDSIRQYFEFYLYFSIIAPSYLIFIKLSDFIKKIRDKDLKTPFFNYGNTSDYLEILITSIILMLCVIVISFFFPDPSSAFFTKDGRDFLMFMAFVSIPVEEIIFRAMALDIFRYITKEILFDIKKIDQNSREDDNEINHDIERKSWFVGILISSILFAIYHIPRYGFNKWLISYLFLMGIAMGLARFRSGMTSAYLIHLINNLLVSYSAIMIPYQSSQSLFYYNLFIILLLIPSMIFLILRKNKEKIKERKTNGRI